MRGYLGESPTGRMQTFYVSPDGNHVVAGLMFRNGGVNVTGVQIGEIQSRFEQAMEESAASTGAGDLGGTAIPAATERSEEHTSELQPLMRNSYAVSCLKP